MSMRKPERSSGLLRWLAGPAIEEREAATRERQRATKRLLDRCDDESECRSASRPQDPPQAAGAAQAPRP